MSDCTGIPNSLTAARAYVKKLSEFGSVKEIWLGGSRSPLRDKKSRKVSDWDFGVITDVDELILVKPREAGIFCADLSINPTNLDRCVMLYPTDTHDVLAIKRRKKG